MSGLKPDNRNFSPIFFLYDAATCKLIATYFHLLDFLFLLCCITSFVFWLTLYVVTVVAGTEAPCFVSRENLENCHVASGSPCLGLCDHSHPN